MPKTPVRPTMPTYAIVHGLAEGTFISRKLRQALAIAGFQPGNEQTADIIITHSGGFFALPKQSKATLFLHINPSYWPGKPLFQSAREKVAYDFRLYRQRHQVRQWALNAVASATYLLNARHGLRMLSGVVHRKNRFTHLPKANHVFVRTHRDNYCDPAALLAAIGNKYTYLTLAGHHDDCWREPEPYARLLQALHNS